MNLYGTTYGEANFEFGSIVNKRDAAAALLDLQRALDLVGTYQALIVAYMERAGVDKVQAGEIEVVLSKPRGSKNHEGKINELLAEATARDDAEMIRIIEDAIKANTATPEPSTAWAKVSADLGADVPTVPSDKPGKFVFKINGKSVGEVESDAKRTKEIAVSDDDLPF